MSTESANIAVQPPVAARKHTERTVHGDTLVDDYAWLREKDDPEVHCLSGGRERCVPR